jgi:hypothetical protein
MIFQPLPFNPVRFLAQELAKLIEERRLEQDRIALIEKENLRIIEA